MSNQIAIDGPAGAGKSTIAKKIAASLGWVYADTGAMYRAMALFCIRRGIDKDDAENIKKAVDEAEVSIKYSEQGQEVWLNGENVNGFIRTEEVSAMTSKIAAFPFVREKLVKLQRELACSTDVVMDGRDIGSVVLPDASCKIFLTASVEERARRRFKEYEEKGIEVDFNQLKEEIEERDYRDSHRDTSPLIQAKDALLLDSSDMTIDEVVDKIIEIYNSKIG